MLCFQVGKYCLLITEQYQHSTIRLSFLHIINKICLFELLIVKENSIHNIQAMHFVFLSGQIILTDTASTIYPLTHAQECCTSHSWSIASYPEIWFRKDTLIEEWDTRVCDSWHKTNVPPPPNPQPLGTLHGLSAQIIVQKIGFHSSFVGTGCCFSLPVWGTWEVLSGCKMRFLVVKERKLSLTWFHMSPRIRSTFYGFGVVIHQESAFLSPRSGM